MISKNFVVNLCIHFSLLSLGIKRKMLQICKAQPNKKRSIRIVGNQLSQILYAQHNRLLHKSIKKRHTIASCTEYNIFRLINCHKRLLKHSSDTLSSRVPCKRLRLLNTFALFGQLHQPQDAAGPPQRLIVGSKVAAQSNNWFGTCRHGESHLGTRVGGRTCVSALNNIL